MDGNFFCNASLYIKLRSKTDDEINFSLCNECFCHRINLFKTVVHDTNKNIETFYFETSCNDLTI